MRLGKMLHEVMGWGGPMTGRQYFWWLKFLERPTDDQRYAMQTAMSVLQCGAAPGTILSWESLDMSKPRPAQEYDPAEHARERGGLVNYRGVLMTWAEYDELRADGRD